MPGRFKISANYYVSEWGGNDAADGTDPNTPYASITAVPSVSGTIVVIGTGVYSGYATAASRQTIGDGRVEIDGLGTSHGTGLLMRGLILKNFNALSFPGSGSIIEDCVLENFTTGLQAFVPNIHRCILKNIPMSSAPILHNCILIGACGGTSTWSMRGSFISKGSIVTVSNTQTFATFTSNCVNGLFLRNGVLYEAKFLKDGSPRPDADPSYLDIATIQANFYTTLGNYAGDPKFLDLESKIVEPDSDLLKSGHASYFVGAVKPGQMIRLDDSNFEFTYTRINTTNPLAVQVESGELDGEIRITGKVSDSLISSSMFSLRTIFAYLKTTPATGSNHDVPDAVKQLGLLDSEIDKPRRLTYWLRTSTDPTANQSSSDLIWDNDGAGSGEWLLMEVNTEPRHVSGIGEVYGNGDPRGEGQIGASFNYRSIDVRIVLDNDRD